MTDRYIPDADSAFDSWQANFVAYVSAHFFDLGLPLVVATQLNTAKSEWELAFADHVAARAAAKAARNDKDAKRRAYIRLIREVTRRIQAHDNTTDADRAGLGITIPDTDPTPVGPPATRPVVKVDFSARLRHRIGFADEQTPTRRAKPKGILGAEVWVKLTDAGDPPPAGPVELTFLMLSTRTPAVAEYRGEDAGKTAHYMVRWLNRRGDPGPWSETASATVGA